MAVRLPLVASRAMDQAIDDIGRLMIGPSTSPPSAWGDSAVWDREYADVQAIPSSLRLAPSRAFTRLQPSWGDVAGKRILDLGAGTGRHSIYVSSLGARVHAIDSSEVACHLHRERAASRNLSPLIEHGTVDEHNLPDGEYDLIIDSYVSCHILSTDGRRRFLDVLMSRLAPGGQLYTAGMGTQDSFYRRHLVADGPDVIAVDPVNSIAKLLQPGDTARRDGRDLARVISSWTERFVEAVGGIAEQREVHAAVLTR